MKKVFFLFAVIGLLVLVPGGAAFAIISTSDVTLEGNEADAAVLVLGNNDTESLVNGVDFSAFGTGAFQLLDKTDDVSKPLGTTTFTLTASGTKAGAFLLSWVDSFIPPPKSFDLVFALKGGNLNFALYLFDDIVLASSSGAYNGTWEIEFLNSGGQTPSLSHLSVYGRVGTMSEVPEPATMLLFGTGLVGLAGIARRKKS